MKKNFILNNEFLDAVLKKYNIKRENLLSNIPNWSCFSCPVMDRHECNYEAKVDGSNCNFCHNNPDLYSRCYHVCAISHVCLSAYLMRMGYGDKRRNEEVLNELCDMKYEEVLQLVKEWEGEFKNSGEEPQINEVKEKKEDDDKYISVQKTAEILGKSVGTVYQWVAKGKVESIKIGRSRRILASSVRGAGEK